MKINLLDLDDRTLEDIIYYVIKYHNEDLHNDYIYEKVELSNRNLNLEFIGNKKISFLFMEVEIMSHLLLLEQLGHDIGVVELIQKYTRTPGFEGPRITDFKVDFVGDSFIEFSAKEAWLEIY